MRFIPGEAAIGLGLVVWLVAATIFPFHLGAGGAPWTSLLIYVALAGGLFAAGDALLNLSFLRNLQELPAQGLMRACALTLPAAAMFMIGATMAPTAERMEDDVCRIGGFSPIDDQTSGPDWDFDADADCVPADARRG